MGKTQSTLMRHMNFGFHFLSFDQDLHWRFSGHLLLTSRQASRASSCTSSWAWMDSTRRVASRRVPLRRPSSEAEARAARLMGKSIFDFACRIDRGRARELVWSLGRNRATRSDPPFGCVAFPKNDPEVKCARPRGACESLTSRVRCSEPFLMIFPTFFRMELGACVHRFLRWHRYIVYLH